MIEPVFEELEEDLRRAMLAGDVARLDALIADELLFVLPTGVVLSKAADLETYRSGLLRLIALEPSERRAVRYGNTAVVSVRVHVVGEYEGITFSRTLRYLRVWARLGDAWRVVAGQATEVQG